MRIDNEITVVIATLGAESLKPTIESLNQGSIVPAEILICIPAALAWKARLFQFSNLKVLETDFRGQVQQRIFGFKNSSCDFVLQLDDDLLVDKFCLQYLLETLRSAGPKAAVAPALVDVKTGHSVYRRSAQTGFVVSLYDWLMNGAEGYVPGRIDKSGSSVGVDPSTSLLTQHEVEWLAGGCVLHHKSNLVLEDFWPLPGKAYYEDVVHSSILAGEGIRLLIDSRARSSLELFRQSSMKPREFFRNLYRDYLGRKYFLDRFSRKSPRMYFYYFGRVASYLLTRRK